MTDEKKCTGCGATLPLSEFYRDARRRNGAYSECRKCTGERGKANRATARVAEARYREAHREEIRQRDRAYYAANPEKRIEAATVNGRGCTVTKGEKRCARCGRTLPLTEFYKDARLQDGLYSSCKRCTVAQHKEYRQRRQAGQRAKPRKGGYTTKHVYNRQFFDDWSPGMAYVLGLVYGDGSVSATWLQFQYSVKDRATLDDIMRLMDIATPPREIDNHGFPAWRIRLDSVHIADRLSEIGLPLGKKSKTIRFPSMENEYKRHFTRGYFDADGCATYAQVRFNSSSAGFLEDVSRAIGDLVGIKAGSLYTCKKTNSLPQGGQLEVVSSQLTYCAMAERRAIYDWFYQDVTEGLYSQRKRNDFETKGLLRRCDVWKSRA